MKKLGHPQASDWIVTKKALNLYSGSLSYIFCNITKCKSKNKPSRRSNNSQTLYWLGKEPMKRNQDGRDVVLLSGAREVACCSVLQDLLEGKHDGLNVFPSLSHDESHLVIKIRNNNKSTFNGYYVHFTMITEHLLQKTNYLGKTCVCDKDCFRWNTASDI